MMKTALPAGLMLALVTALHAASSPAVRPNVVVILSDDMGYADVGFNGAKDIPTPNLDALAKGGARFTQAYVTASICSPSRAGLITGRHQARWGHDSNWSDGVLVPTEEPNLGQRLKGLGYATGIFGKWHLGASPMDQPADNELSFVRGFDEVYLTCHNAQYFEESYLDSFGEGRFVQVADKSLYNTDLCAERGAGFIRKHKNEPFFLYMPFNAVHENVYAPLKLEAPQKYLDRVPNITDPSRRLMAAMMIGLDDAVGTLMQALRENALEENTLIVFLSDNGGSIKLPEGTCRNTPFRGGKGTFYEGGIRTPLVMSWKRHIAPCVYDHLVSSLDIAPTAIAAAGGVVDPAWQLDGVNLLPFLNGTATGSPHPALYWRTGAQGVVRKGDWKLIFDPSGNCELFNLAKDEGETSNLAKEYPSTVAELEADWKQWNAHMGKPQATEPPPGFKPFWLREKW